MMRRDGECSVYETSRNIFNSNPIGNETSVRPDRGKRHPGNLLEIVGKLDVPGKDLQKVAD